MGKSCSFYSETYDAHLASLESILMAKKLFDLGRKIPGDYVFSYDTNDRFSTFFIKAITLLTDYDVIVHEDDDFELSLEIVVPGLKRWQLHLSDEFIKDWICHPLADEEFETNYGYASTFIRIQTESGFILNLNSSIGAYYVVFENFCECYTRLQQKITEWSIEEATA